LKGLKERKELAGVEADALMAAQAPANDVLAASLNNPTSLQFGSDGRLYVAQQNGLIKVFTIVKNGPGDYAITARKPLT
jgi:hypothetical protein